MLWDRGGEVLSCEIRLERKSSLKEVQKEIKAGQRAEAGGPGGPRTKVQDETEAPRRMLDSGLVVPGVPGGRSPIHEAPNDEDGGDVLGEYEISCEAKLDDGAWICDCGVSDEAKSWARARIEVGIIILSVID